MSSTAQPAAVLFDLDGTLLDSIELIVRAFQHSTTVHLGEPIARSVIVPSIGRALIEVLEELAPSRGAELFATYRQFVLRHHDDLARLYPGVTTTLTTLRERGYRLGIVTSKSRPVAQLAFNAYGLDRLVDLTICLEDTPRAKPEPDPLLVAAARLGLAPATGLYVGDSVHDLVAARAAGMPAAAALWGPTQRETLAAHAPAHLLGQIDDLLSLCPAPPSA